jgi:hypothetical protein
LSRDNANPVDSAIATTVCTDLKIALNLGGLLWLWFASKLHEKNNGFRKATIIVLGINGLAGAAIVVALLVNPGAPITLNFFWGRSVRLAPIISVWIASAFTAVYLIPMAWLLASGTRAAFERRAERGLCVGCGYDLRGSLDRCPECGMAYSK